MMTNGYDDYEDNLETFVSDKRYGDYIDMDIYPDIIGLPPYVDDVGRITNYEKHRASKILVNMFKRGFGTLGLTNV